MPQTRRGTSFAQWTDLSSPNTYGNTSAWIDALNLGSPTRATTAYNSAVIQPQPYSSSSLGSQDVMTQAAIKNQYATSELGQGTITSTLSTLGKRRDGGSRLHEL